ncbi:pollen Ole e 1 allergen and extensin family protein [Canna indica]|uniref:Pollen Ole e 1 allergen and extensin family protein n=1 Tax=Canna indica TaxID=4628 RepID=A0AAQ3QAS4_9LILI|nr:pollen Ole e 1 allergen and extensin family protein [Canna indica]
MRMTKMTVMDGVVLAAVTAIVLCVAAEAWTGEIRGRVVCDDLSENEMGNKSAEHSLAGAEVAVLCITKSGEVFNYQAFTNSRGIYTVAETMPETDRWVSCLARPIKSFHERCTRRGDSHSGIKFTYNLTSGHSHTVKPFLYKPATAPIYCTSAE